MPAAVVVAAAGDGDDAGSFGVAAADDDNDEACDGVPKSLFLLAAADGGGSSQPMATGVRELSASVRAAKSELDAALTAHRPAHYEDGSAVIFRRVSLRCCSVCQHPAEEQRTAPFRERCWLTRSKTLRLDDDHSVVVVLQPPRPVVDASKRP